MPPRHTSHTPAHCLPRSFRPLQKVGAYSAAMNTGAVPTIATAWQVGACLRVYVHVFASTWHARVTVRSAFPWSPFSLPLPWPGRGGGGVPPRLRRSGGGLGGGLCRGRRRGGGGGGAGGAARGGNWGGLFVTVIRRGEEPKPEGTGAETTVKMKAKRQGKPEPISHIQPNTPQGDVRAAGDDGPGTCARQRLRRCARAPRRRRRVQASSVRASSAQANPRANRRSLVGEAHLSGALV